MFKSVDGQTTGRLAALAGEEGYRIKAVGSGLEVLDVLEVEAVDLVVTKLFLTDVDGWELLDQLRT